MKKIVLILIVALLAAELEAQFRYENADDNMNNTAKMQTRIDKYGKKLQPDIIFDGRGEPYKKFGISGEFVITKSIIEEKWVEKGYKIDKGPFGYDVNSFVVMSCILTPNVKAKNDAEWIKMKKNWFEVCFGAGLDMEKQYYALIGGFLLVKNNFYFSAIGNFPVSCAFDIHGYDPNSWYRVFISYKLKNWHIGAASIRSYTTGLLLEYDPRSDRLGKIQIIAGKDLEFKRNSITASFVISLDD